MAAYEVAPDGHVIPPLNITQPTPSMSLNGFEWGTVSDDIRISPANQGYESGPPPETAATQLAEQLKIGEKPEAGVGPVFPLEQFQGPYAGNGFNMIFRPRKFPKAPPTFVDFDGKTVTGSQGIDDNVLQLNLTVEQVSFGGPLGNIPNRGFGKQDDITLFGVPYLQTVADVTNPDGNNPKQTGIHFEPGVWLNVPAADFQQKKASIVRMASIPHGTTINAQGFAPQRNNSQQSVIGGEVGPPNFDLKENQIDARPFVIGKPETADKLERDDKFPNMNADSKKAFRIPQDLKKLASSGKITSALIRNPNLYLKTAIDKLHITETITFEVNTGPGPPDQELNGGGTANIAFLAGEQRPITTAAPTGEQHPITTAAPPGGAANAQAVSMKARYWIERVMYRVPVGPLKGNEEMKVPVFAQMPPDSTAPTPKFLIKAPPCGIPNKTVIDVPGIQIQSSQNVFLNFGGLTWPHVSVSTLVPVEPQRFTVPEQKQ